MQSVQATLGLRQGLSGLRAELRVNPLGLLLLAAVFSEIRASPCHAAM